MNIGMVGTLMVASKLFDGVIDLFFGNLIDRTRTKMGRPRPWMIYGFIDLAVGYLKALEYAAENVGVEAINLGTGNGVSVLELVNAFEKVNGIKLPCVIGPRRAGDLPAF